MDGEPDHIEVALACNWISHCREIVFDLLGRKPLVLDDVILGRDRVVVFVTRTDEPKPARAVHWSVSKNPVARHLRWKIGAFGGYAFSGGHDEWFDGKHRSIVHGIGVPRIFRGSSIKPAPVGSTRLVLQCDPASWSKVRPRVSSGELLYTGASRPMHILAWFEDSSDAAVIRDLDRNGAFR